MGAECVKSFALFSCNLVICVSSYPVAETGLNEAATELSSSEWSFLLALTFTVTCVIVLLGCLNCCKQRIRFKEFRNSVSEPNINNVGLDFVNPLQNVSTQNSKYSIFSSIVEAIREKQPDSIVTFEPLPKILPDQFYNPRLPQLNWNSDDVAFIDDWLVGKDFPREQLHYLRECGQGWFGKVVEGEARGIVSNNNKIHRVFVRILKEGALASEQACFLHEAKPYKNLSHPNVLKLLGRCLENVPFLLVFEACPNGDLKSYLKQNFGNRDALVFQGIILRMAVDIASGLSYMLQHSFVHTDIAARNCLVTGDLRVKVGDYGTSLQNYKDEYYFNGDVALPIRWYAPETLRCSESTIQPQQITGTSCIWSYGVLLWELEEWGELPHKDLTNDQVIEKIFGNEELRLSCPINRTPYTQEMYNIMKECWKDYIDRPSFIHVVNALSALMHKFKNNDFDSRWHTSKSNTISIIDNEDKLRGRVTSLSNKEDNDSGIDLNNSKMMSGLSLLQLQQGSPKHRLINDECSSESPVSSRRFSNSSAGDLFSSLISMKHRSPSLENLHGSLDNISSFNKRFSNDESFKNSTEFNCFKEYRRDSEDGSKRYQDSSIDYRTEGNTKVDFCLGLISNIDCDSLWNNNQPLFESNSLQEDNSLVKRIDSLSTYIEDEIWRKRVERGEFTEKVKEKSKSVADLMILTHIDCSESSESDSLPSFHSRQSSFNRQFRLPKSNAPFSLLNSLNFGSESNLPVVEKDQEFQDTLKKIQIAKINGNDDSLSFMSLQANSPAIGRADVKTADFSGKTVHFLANEASEKNLHSSHIIQNTCNNALVISDFSTSAKNKLPLFNNNLRENNCFDVLASNNFKIEKYEYSKSKFSLNDENKQNEINNVTGEDIRNVTPVLKGSSECDANNFNFLFNSVKSEKNDEIIKHQNVFQSSMLNVETKNSVSSDSNEIEYDRAVSDHELISETTKYSSKANDTVPSPTFLHENPVPTLSSSLSSPAPSTIHKNLLPSSSIVNDHTGSVVIGPSERHTLEYFKGLKTTLLETREQSKEDKENVTNEHCNECPRTLDEFLSDIGDDYFYKCIGDEIISNRCQPDYRSYRNQYCDYCFDNECSRCKNKSSEDNCLCESFEHFKKFRDCTTLNSCPFQSDDSGRGTDQINSGDGSSDKSLESSISVQMNEVKNRLEDVIAKFAVTDELSDDSCSSLENDKDTRCIERLNTVGQFHECKNYKKEIQKVIKHSEHTINFNKSNNTDELIIEEEEEETIEKNSKNEERIIPVEEVGVCFQRNMPEHNRMKNADMFIEEISKDVVAHDNLENLFTVSEEIENPNSRYRTIDNANSAELSSDNSNQEFNFENNKKDDSADTRSFVKVEQLFFMVDPKFEKDIEIKLGISIDCNNERISNNSSNVLQEQHKINFDNMSETEDEVANKNYIDYSNLHPVQSQLKIRTIDDNHTFEENLKNNTEIKYEISDILEGLSEPVSFSYSASSEHSEINNEIDIGENDSCDLQTSNFDGDDNTIPDSWLPSPIEVEDYKPLEMDERFLEAIRNELREKLPNNASLGIIEPEETWTENANITIEYNTYPTQLSPILELEEEDEDEDEVEEEEEELSSSSSLQSLKSSKSEDESTIVVSVSESPKKYLYGIPDMEEILMVNVDTNEASILERTDSSSCIPFINNHKLNETYEIDENESTIEIEDNLDSDSLPSPESLSPGTSSKTAAHLSYSSSESGNLSDVFLSPSSLKNFDEFDVSYKSPADGNRHVNTPENIPYSSNELYRDDYQKAIFNIDKMLRDPEFSGPFKDLNNEISFDTSINADLIDSVSKKHNEAWLKSCFIQYNETSSLIDLNNLSDTSEVKFQSLPADFKSENWPTVNELVMNLENNNNQHEEKICVNNSSTSNNEHQFGSNVDATEFAASKYKKPGLTKSFSSDSNLLLNIKTEFNDIDSKEKHESRRKASSMDDLHNASTNNFSNLRDQILNTDQIKIESLSTLESNEENCDVIDKSEEIPTSNSEFNNKIISCDSDIDVKKKPIDDINISNTDADNTFSEKTSFISFPVESRIRSELSEDAKLKNSIALFGNTSKQIRNFQVSLVKDDNYVSSKSSPIVSKLTVPRVDSYLNGKLSSSIKSSEKTWKSPLNSFLSNQNLETLGLKEINMNDMLMSTSFIDNGSQDGSTDDKDDMKSDESDDENEIESTSEEFIWQKGEKNTDDSIRTDEGKIDSDDDDDDEEELADFTPFSWNCGALPQRSALKNKDEIKGCKKNVSFKKQKYHCVYEYPKEETDYKRLYDNILQDRMLNFWNIDRDYIYGDYSSFSDWELSDCGEEQLCSDDLLPYPGTAPLPSKNNTPEFYTIGNYDLDTTLINEKVANTSKEFEYENFKISNDDKNSIVNEIDYPDLPSPGLGELRHTKNRLKLDLNCKSDLTNNKFAFNKTHLIDEIENDKNDVTSGTAENSNYVNDYGLNYKSYDLSPVVELTKSLTSTSVA